MGGWAAGMWKHAESTGLIINLTKLRVRKQESPDLVQVVVLFILVFSTIMLIINGRQNIKMFFLTVAKENEDLRQAESSFAVQ